MQVYLKLFNTVLRSGIMPQTWCNGRITPIFKRLFCSILNQRLLDHVKSLDILHVILHKSQIDLLGINRTADHVLTLRTLILKYVHGHQTKEYACFVDLRKASDSVRHDGLVYKLLQCNVRGNLLA